jgi:hypothetical protein
LLDNDVPGDDSGEFGLTVEAPPAALRFFFRAGLRLR